MTRSRLFTYLLSVGLVLCIGTSAASALQNEKVVRGTSNSSIYKSGQNIDITGTVNGDIYCAGQTVTVNATVNGDVLCAGQTVTVSGTVHGNVRVAGQTVFLNSTVDRSVTIAAQTANIGSGANIGSDLSVFGRSTHLDGQVARDVIGGSEEMTISGTVGRNVDANVDGLKLVNGAKVLGSVTYTSPHTLNKQSGAVINGKVVRHEPKRGEHERGSRAGLLLFALIAFLTMLVFAMVLVALFPWFFREAATTLRSWPWWELLIGFVASLFMPAIIIVLFLSVIGIPLGILLTLFWIATAMVSGPIAAFYVGRLVMRRAQWPAPLIMLVGGAILIFLYLIPVLNLIIIPLAYWIGTGMLLTYLWRGWRHPVYHEAEAVHGSSKTSRR